MEPIAKPVLDVSTERDWSAWLPPVPTCDPGRYSNSEDKWRAAAARPGEVYASRWGVEGERARVWECRADGDHVLAGMTGGAGPDADRWPCVDPSPRGRLQYNGAILVQAVGQAEPTSPEVLYANLKPIVLVENDDEARAMRDRIAALPSRESDVATCETAYIRGFRRGLFRDPPPGESCERDADVMNAHSGDYTVGMQDGTKLREMTGSNL